MTLEESLRDLATDDEARVPDRVDAAVMAAWDASRGGEAERRVGAGPRWYVWAVSGSALIAVFGVWTASRGTGEGDVRSIADQPPALYVPHTPDADAPSVTLERHAPPIRRELPSAETVLPVQRRPDTALVLVPEFDNGGPLTLMRVRMERRAFSRLGLPITNPDGDGFVDVEVLVGEDGVARSIRRAVAVGWTGPNP